MKQRIHTLVLVCMALSLLVLSGCSQPNSGTVQLAEDTALFGSSDLSRALTVTETSYQELIGIELNDEESGIELPYTEVDEAEGDLDSLAVVPGASGWLVLYRVNAGGTYQIRLHDEANGGSGTTVYAGTDSVDSVAVSADGNSVVAAVNNPAHGQNDVYLFDIGAGAVYQLSNTANKDETNVSMTADASKIAWQRDAGGKERPYICDYSAATHSCALSSLGNGVSQIQPSLSANGEYLALVRLGGVGYQVRLYDFAASSYSNIKARADVLSHPSVDDTGTKVMYLWERSSNGRDYVRVRDLTAGTFATELSSVAGLDHPFMTRDGAYTTYQQFIPAQSKYLVRTRDIATNATANVQGGSWDYFQPVWMMASPPVPQIPANVIVVDKDATGLNNGSSWENAFTKLRDALHCVNNGVSQDAHCAGRTFDDAGVDEIWVAAGTYYPDEAVYVSVTNNSTTEDFLLNQDTVKLYGGFDGVGAGGVGGAQETELSQRNPDPMTNGTVLSGDIDKNDPALGHSGTNARRVVYMGTNFETLSADTVIDGFQIAKGNGDVDGAGLYCDGIVVNKNCSATFRNLYFYDNIASGSKGGAMYLENGIPGDFNDMIFYANNAQYGGAIYMKDFDFGSNTVNPNNAMERLGFYSNYATVAGGAIYAENSKATGGLKNSVFVKNGAFNAGGAIAINLTFADTGHRWNIYNNTFHDNDVTLYGGAINITTGSTLTTRAASISSNMFTNNDSGGAGFGDDLRTNLGNASADVFFGFNRVTGNTVSGINADAIEDSGAGSTFIGAGNIYDGGTVYVDSNGADNVLGTPDDNFQLVNCFAGIDAGASNNGVTGTDFAGNPRIVSGCNGIGIDIGAYEYQP